MKIHLKLGLTSFVYCLIFISATFTPTQAQASVATYCMWGYTGTSPSASPLVVTNAIYDSFASLYGNALEVYSEAYAPIPLSAVDYFPLSSAGGNQGHNLPASLDVFWSIGATGTIGTVTDIGFLPNYGHGCSESFIFSTPSPSVTVSPSSAVLGDLVTIAWNTVFNTAYDFPICTFDGDLIAPGGTHSFAATTSDARTYTLSCYNLFGYRSASDTLTVETPSCSEASIDTGITNTMSTWGPLPYERGFVLRCTSNNVTTPMSFNDSFHEVWSGASRTNDPCAVALGWIPNYNMVAGSHSHPLFTNAAEVNRESGCHGIQRPGITMMQINALNQDNEGFSINDAAFPPGRGPLYLLTPNATTIKKLTCGNPATCTTQVYP